MCRVSSRLKALVLPLLYRNVVLGVTTLNDGLTAMFHKGNQGLRHIRSIRVVELHSLEPYTRGGKSPWTVYFDSGRHLRALKNLLRLVPKHRLRFFQQVDMAIGTLSTGADAGIGFASTETNMAW
jgi:hypothetical protein